MYESAPINLAHYHGTRIRFEKDRVEIDYNPEPGFFHGMGSVHGSVAFKMLDDVSFFAAQAWESTFFILTTSFNIQFLRPVGLLPVRAIGVIRQKSKSLLVSEARLLDERGKELAFGTGNFVRSQTELISLDAYSSPFQ